MARRRLMPNLPTHIALAGRAAERIDHHVIDNNQGAYLLGATTPDIRIITKKPRAEYHFTTLDFQTIGTGMNAMFAAHPELSALTVQDTTRAFIAGYLTHLLADELWISAVFRPYFANTDLFPDSIYGLVMDRACQLQLDRENRPQIKPLLNILTRPICGITISFIPDESIRQWQKWVVEFLNQRAFSWDRLRNQARRIANGQTAHPAYDHANTFIDDLPESLEQLYTRVPAGEFSNYQTDTVDILAGTLRDYLQSS